MRRTRAVSMLAATGLLATLVVAPAGAQPSSDEVRDELQTAEQRLDELQMREAAVVEDYNEARVALEASSAELAETEAEIEALSGEVDELLEAAGDHARRLHKLGPTVELSSMFVASDHGEVGARTTALRRIMEGQRADFEGLEAARTQLAAAEERLAEQHELASAREAEVAEQREEVEAVLAASDAEIAELQDELAEAEEREAEAERRRQEAEERRQRQRQEAREQAAREEAAEQEAAESTQTTSTGGSSTGSSNGSGGSGGGSGGGSSQPPAPSTRQSASVAVQTALNQVGKPYRYGSAGPNSFDCSGLTSFAWRAAGVEITRTSRSQYAALSPVSRGNLQPGDLVFYSRNGTAAGIGHVAMYIGGGEIVEASRTGIPVRRSSSGLSRGDIIGYRRP